MRLNKLRAGVSMGFALLFATMAYGQGAASAVARAPVAPVAVLVAQPVPSGRDISELVSRVGNIESAVTKLLDKASSPDRLPTMLAFAGGLLGVAVGGVISVLTQRKLLAHQVAEAEKTAFNTRQLANDKAEQERKLAADRSKLEVGNSFVQWQLQQLKELYGPLHALLRQSNALYRHMNAVLERADANRFRLGEGAPGDDFDDKVFEISLEGQWVRFRTVMHIGEVYGHGYGIEDYFDQVVAIGGRMVKVIEEKAGFARPDQKELISMFGRYLAHYAVLERLHKSVQAKHFAALEGKATPTGAVSEIKVDASAVFPKEIQGLVDAGYALTLTDLNVWRAKAAP